MLHHVLFALAAAAAGVLNSAVAAANTNSASPAPTASYEGPVVALVGGGFVTARRPADASETTRDVEVTFDLRDHGDQSNIARLARISWRGDTVEEQPVRGAGAVVRLAEPFTVRAILDHELVVRDAATDAILAHVTARPDDVVPYRDKTKAVRLQIVDAAAYAQLVLENQGRTLSVQDAAVELGRLRAIPLPPRAGEERV